jgi:hypothetical protein
VAAGGSLPGESWHNLPHSDRACARHGVDHGQLDASAGLIRAFERLGWAGNIRWQSAARLDQHQRQAGDAAGHAIARGRVPVPAQEGPRMSRPGDPAKMTADPGACAVPLVLLSQNQQAGPACPADAVPG